MSMEVQALECYMHTNVAGLNRLDLDHPTPIEMEQLFVLIKRNGL
jgi:hypothetical protein